MAEQIPLAPSSSFSLRVDLDDVEYELRFVYMQRADLWRMDLYTADGDAIVLGRNVVLGTLFLAGNRHENRPPGDLIFIDSSQKSLEPGLTSLGERVSLFYVSQAEIG